MHDRAVIVAPDIIAVDDVLVELALHAGFDVGPVDGHEGVAVFAALFVPEAHRMADLVDGVAGAAAGTQTDGLHAVTLHTQHRPASAGIAELDEVGILRSVRRGAFRKADGRARFPVRDRVPHPLLIRQGGVDPKGNLGIGPAKACAGDDDTTRSGIILVRCIFGLLQLGDCAQHDVTFEDGQVVDLVVHHFGRSEGDTGDDAGGRLARLKLTLADEFLVASGAGIVICHGTAPCVF